MRIRIITLLLVLGTLITACNQKQNLDEASPFTAVKWEKEQPIVKFNNQWYQFEKLDKFTKKELLDFSKKNYGRKWQKRFSEDLMEVLKRMNYQPKEEVKLVLSKNGKSETYTGILTAKNRKKVVVYNKKTRKKASTKAVEHITTAQAIEDINEFEALLDNSSSYVRIGDFDYKKAIKELKEKLQKENASKVNVNVLANELAQIMAQVGDRHSSVRNKGYDTKSDADYNLRLPFGLSVLNGKVVALQRDNKTKTYSYLHKNYPYVKSINGMPISKFISKYAYHGQKAPKDAQLSRGVDMIQKFGKLLFYNNMKPNGKVAFVFTNGKNNKAESYKLTTDKKTYVPEMLISNYMKMNLMQNGKFDKLTRTLEGNIGYINIPMMMHYDDTSGLEASVNNSMKKFANTKALIIDLRNNPGGGREILNTFAGYFVQPNQSPWVANVAYLRTNEKVNSDESSMNGRFLYTYNSKELTDADRAAIDKFNADFKTKRKFDKSKFSVPFYMVLHSGKTLYTKPVYILVNENCFSAATVFTTAFKGLPNVKIVGVTTDGSSGNSRKNYLKNSNIRAKVSTMLSFQRNGKTLDGNGTNPDIYLPIDETQLLTGKDTQLSRLIDRINQK